MEQKTIRFLEDYLKDYEQMNFAEAVYTLIVKKNVDKTRLRNAMIIHDFDTIIKERNVNFTTLYEELADSYSVSYDSIRVIIKHRKLNQI